MFMYPENIARVATLGDWNLNKLPKLNKTKTLYAAIWCINLGAAIKDKLIMLLISHFWQFWHLKEGSYKVAVTYNCSSPNVWHLVTYLCDRSKDTGTASSWTSHSIYKMVTDLGPVSQKILKSDSVNLRSLITLVAIYSASKIGILNIKTFHETDFQRSQQCFNSAVRTQNVSFQSWGFHETGPRDLSIR